MKSVKVILKKVKRSECNGLSYEYWYRKTVKHVLKEIREDQYGYAIKGDRNTLAVYVNNRHNLRGLLGLAENYALDYRIEGNAEILPQYA